jgi:hypothetical protein
MNDVVCTGRGRVQSTRSQEIWNDGELCFLDTRKVDIVEQILFLVVTAHDDADVVVLLEQKLQNATADEAGGAGYHNVFFTHGNARENLD